MASTLALPRLPLIGRSTERARLRALLVRARGGQGGTIFLAGESGVGKSRLAAAAVEEAQKGDWLIAMGRAHPVERTIAFSLADAFVPLLQALPAGRLDVLARGATDHLATLFPILRGHSERRGPADVTSSAELFWSFAQVVKGLAEHRPLLVVLDDVQWADPSSLDLLHFLARQISGSRIAIICAVNTEHEARPWRTVQQSLITLDVAKTIDVLPLTAEDLVELVRVAGIPTARIASFAQELFERTQGNPFFAEEIVKQVLERGTAYDPAPRNAAHHAALPGSVREAVLLRLDGLEPDVRALTERVAVIGTRAGYDVIRAVTHIDESQLVSMLESAVRFNVLVEAGDNRSLAYDFRHPLLRETLYRELSGARRRLLHTQVAEALDVMSGNRSSFAAADIAPHLLAGDADRFGVRASEILTAAGEAALARFADREADNYLTAALDMQTPETPPGVQVRLLKNIARARQRLGRFDDAITLLRRSRDLALSQEDSAAVADVSRRIAAAHFRAGRFEEALPEYNAAIAAADRAGDAALLGRTYIERGTLLQGIGRVPDAAADLAAALATAQSGSSPMLLARAERALLLLHTLSGPADRAREHSARAVSAAELSGDRALLCSCHWAAAVLAGMTGNVKKCEHHINNAHAIADTLRSPLLRLAINELEIEFAYGMGEWDRAIAIGDEAIALARALNQRTLLPRLLVWTALVHIGRDDMANAVPLVDEAWALAMASGTTAAMDVHAVVPAHIARAALHLARLELDEAIRVAEAGLAIADSTGYRAWAVHRLLPTIAEAYLHQNDFAAAGRAGERLRRDAVILDNTLGLAWADTADAFVCWLAGDVPRSVELLRKAADALDAIPHVPDAARLRRQLAGRLADLGDREAALRELRQVHDVFTGLGAARELEKTRIQFRELGTRPPLRTAGPGAAGLTGRELEIVRLVAARKSNKAIARELDVSARTVTTHMSNIFRKLAVSTRGELTDYARSLPLD